MDKHIASEQNPVFRSLRDCLQTKGIKKHELFIVSGSRVVSEMLERHTDLVRDLIMTDAQMAESSADAALIARARELRARLKANQPEAFSILSLERALFEELDIFGTHAPLLVLRTPEIPTIDLAQAPEGLEVLCALGDPANLGALLRSAAAFGAAKIILLKESASPFHPKAVRAASATTLLTALAKGPSIQELATLPLAGSVVALDMQGKPLDSFPWPKDVRLLIGEEGAGVPAGARFDRVAIQMRAGVESLNATVAAGIALHAYSARR